MSERNSVDEDPLSGLVNGRAGVVGQSVRSAQIVDSATNPVIKSGGI